jgi:hypothetical protein
MAGILERAGKGQLVRICTAGAVLLVMLVGTLVFWPARPQRPKAHTEDTPIRRPYSEQELDRLILPGTTRRQLLTMFGEPAESRARGGTERILEFEFCSAQHLKAPQSFVLTRFRVVLSNDLVTSWKPLAYTSIGTP